MIDLFAFVLFGCCLLGFLLIIVFGCVIVYCVVIVLFTLIVLYSVILFFIACWLRCLVGYWLFVVCLFALGFDVVFCLCLCCCCLCNFGVVL